MSDNRPVIVQVRDLLKTFIGKESQEPVPWRSQAHTPNSDRSLNTTRDRLVNEGTLLSVNVRIVSGSPSVGRVHVRVVQEDENQREVNTLCMGYVYPGHEIHGSGALVIRKGDFLRLDSRSSQSGIILMIEARLLRDRKQAGGWSGVQKGSLEGPGFVQNYAGTDPAAGVGVSDSVPTNARWKMISIRIQLVTSSQVANRLTVLQINQTGGQALFYSKALETQAENLTRDISYMGGGPQTGPTGQTFVAGHLPSDLFLSQAFIIDDNTQSFQVLDNLGGPRYHVEEWIEE